MKKIILFLLAICIALILGGFLFRPTNRIDMAINALQHMVREDGTIVYEIDFLENKTSGKNNMVREMGSAYALAFAYHQTQDPKLEKELRKILKQMEKRCMFFGEYYCFIPENKYKIKVGATALALLAELYFEQTSQDFSFAFLRDKMLEALLFSFKKGKGVIISPFEQDKTSPFFDGETWFALSVYNLFYPEDRKVSDLLAQLDDTMFKIYQDQYIDSFVHWGIMAASHRFVTTKDKKFVDFLKTQFNLYVKEELTAKAGGNICSISEGLSDIVFSLGDAEPDFADQVYKRINKNMEKIVTLQLISEKITGEKAKQYPRIHPNTQKYIGAFLMDPNNYKTRNDITQHCLIALLKHKRASEKIQKP